MSFATTAYAIKLKLLECSVVKEARVESSFNNVCYKQIDEAFHSCL